MEFKNKTILIISPNEWGNLYISKHHYAIELSKKGNSVFFLNPPNHNLKTKIEIIQTEYPNIKVVNYKTFFPYKIRFHLRFLYDFLMNIQIKRILKKINSKIDIVWCFDFNLFSDLKVFNADFKIYHPVDPVIYKHQILPAKTADILISVSEKILLNFKNIKTKSIFINHGIEENFKIIAENNLKIQYKNNSNKIKTGYFGNLTRPVINEKITRQIITENQNIDFYFWGPYNSENNNLGGSEREIPFIEFLKIQKNVFLQGIKSKTDLVKEIENIDVFMLIYNEDKATSDRSNSHKLIEYLSTGKVTVANQFETYIPYKDYIVMPENDDDNEIPGLFKKVISNLDFYNSPELQRKRIEYALENTYEKQIDRIEKILTEIF
jgi:hypothetical protein